MEAGHVSTDKPCKHEFESLSPCPRCGEEWSPGTAAEWRAHGHTAGPRSTELRDCKHPLEELRRIRSRGTVGCVLCGEVALRAIDVHASATRALEQARSDDPAPDARAWSASEPAART